MLLCGLLVAPSLRAEPEPAVPAVSAEEQASLESLLKENTRLRRENKRLLGQIAGDSAIDADNRELRYELMRLRTERARLRQENDELNSLRYQVKWGGALFLAGLTFGFIVAIRRARRRFDREMGRL